MDKVADSFGLQLLGASWSARNYKLSAAFKEGKRFRGKSGILIIR